MAKLSTNDEQQLEIVLNKTWRKFKVANERYFEKDTPGTRSSYDYFQGRYDAATDILRALNIASSVEQFLEEN